jgi:hypothetical protein
MNYYRSQMRRVPPAGNLAVRDEQQKIAPRFPICGYERITPELQRRGHAVNHKRVLRLMRADNLQCLRRRVMVRTPTANMAGRRMRIWRRRSKPRAEIRPAIWRYTAARMPSPLNPCRADQSFSRSFK